VEHLGSGRIEELEGCVKRLNVIISNLDEVVSKRNRELAEAKELTHSERLIIESKKVRIAQLEKALDDLGASYNTAQNNLKASSVTTEVLMNEVTLLREAFLEERKERRELSERVQEFAGLKGRTYADITGTYVEAKQPPIKITGKPTRASVLRHLEERASNLMKRQRDKEAEAITKGDLPAVEVVNGVT
jgi:DNA repair exonuclease SbcCD ATPase subunit